MTRKRRVNPGVCGVVMGVLLLGHVDVVAAQGAVPGAARPPRAAAGTTVAFAEAPLAEVIRGLADLLGRAVVLGDIPDVKVTVRTPGAMDRTGVEQLLESLLETHGLMLVGSGAIAQVLPAERALQGGGVTVSAPFPDPAPLGLVSHLVPLKVVRAEEGAEAVRALLGKGGRVEVVPRANAVLLVDRGRQVARAVALLQALDAAPGGEAGLQSYVVNLKYAKAEELAAALGQAFGIPVAGGGAVSLADRALSRALEGFRQREGELFRSRAPQTAPPTASVEGARDSVPGALVGRTTIVPNVPTNALLIRTAPANFALLRETIAALDVRPAQVLFEVTIAEIALGRGFEFGVDWAAVNRGGDVDFAFGNPEMPDTGAASGLLRLVYLDGTGVRTLLRTLASTSTVRVLSTPEILATNNQEASFLVGSKVPFIASTRLGNDVSIDRAVQYQDVGTKLSLLPTINDDGYVSVQLLQEVSSLTPQTVAAALSAPVISTREASTRVLLRDGQTVVIAGLIGESRQELTQGLPLLRDLPLLGALFRRQVTSRQRTELAIFMTPYVVRDDREADAIRERVRQRMERGQPDALSGTVVSPARRPPAP